MTTRSYPQDSASTVHTVYDRAVERAGRSFTTDMSLLLACQPHFPKNAHAAAALLTCLVGWQTYVEDHDLNVIDGHAWVFMTDSDWMSYCGVSRGQASRIMAKFEELGWVISAQMARLNGRTSRPVTWYRLLPEGFPEAPAEPKVSRGTARTSARYRATDARGTARHPGVAPSSSDSFTSESSQMKSRAVPRDTLLAWEPSEALKEWTRETNPRVGHGDLEQFRDHHAAKGTRIIDIEATWRNWVRNTVRFGAVGDGQARRARLDNSFDDVAAAFLAAEAQREMPAQLELGS